jgi:hypothetical protein
MRRLIFVLLASCTYPVTNVANEIIETDAAHAGDDASKDVAKPDTMPDDAAATGEDAGADANDAAQAADAKGVDAAPLGYARCVSTAGTGKTGICPGDPYQSGDITFPIISWGSGSCNINGGKSGTRCAAGSICYLTDGNGSSLNGHCQ